MDEATLGRVADAARDQIASRFPAGEENGAAAVLLADGSILTGVAPEAVNQSVTVCHETEPFCAAYRLDREVVATICLHRLRDGRFLVLSPCGVCRERLAPYGPDVLVAVASDTDPSVPRWVRLGEALPHYWVTVFPDEVPRWIGR